VIRARDLVQRLTRLDPGAWSVVERDTDTAIASDTAAQRHDHQTRLSLIVHHDTPRGRGTAQLDLTATSGSADDVIDHAIALADLATGPAWPSTPPAAAARITLADDDLLQRDLDSAAAATLARVRRPADATTTVTLALTREQTTLTSSSGFHATWLATSLRADAIVTLARTSPSAPRLAITRRARRADDLDLDAALASAALDLRTLTTATAPAPGPCSLWLTADALLHDDDLGLWSLFAHQADAAFERQGLTRFRLGAELAPGAAQLPEPLSIISDGALDFATRSVPITDDAVAIRRFPLVERGVATGLGLSPREAALRGTDPNGGIRNLLVSPGTWSPAPSPTDRTVELRRAASVSIDPYTATATLDIAFALDHRPGRPPLPLSSGTLRLDLLTSLALALRSPSLLRRAAYHGPAALLLPSAVLLP
jgi:predicted Zn-dependent protease